MWTLIGAVIGFGAMLAARGRAGIAAALAILGLVFGMGASLVVGIDFVADFIHAPNVAQEPDWDFTKVIAGLMAAAPGLLGAAFARRD